MEKIRKFSKDSKLKKYFYKLKDFDLDLYFEYFVENEGKVYFAFHYPYSYEENINFLEDIALYKGNNDFYFNQEVLIKSP